MDTDQSLKKYLKAAKSRIKELEWMMERMRTNLDGVHFSYNPELTEIKFSNSVEIGHADGDSLEDCVRKAMEGK